MPTIALYANKINQMPELIKDVKKSVVDYNAELSALKNESLKINQSICNLSDVINSVQASSQTQQQKTASLETFRQNSEQFIEETARIDSDVADAINEWKDNFYEKYNYLKPDCKEGKLEKLWNDCKSGLKSAGEWCKEHWKEILTTFVIVVGAILAIIAVVATGGMALVPILTSVLTAIGFSAGTAMTVATVASLIVATIAVISTVGSSTLNIIDTWCDIDNPIFNWWQTTLNIACFVSNGFYSIGGIYNGIKGISNANLRNYGKEWMTNPRFRSAISGAKKYNFILKINSSTFWSGIGDKGRYNGDQIAANCADKMGRTTLETTLTSNGIELPNWDISNPASINAWNSASSSFAMHSSGNVSVLLGNTVRPDSVWNVFERTILGINPNVGNITIYTPTAVNVISRTTQVSSLITSLFIGSAQTGTLLNDWN